MWSGPRGKRSANVSTFRSSSLRSPLTQNMFSGENTSCFQLPEFDGFDAILHLDNDILINSESPSPFDSWNPEKIGLVDKHAPQTLTDDEVKAYYRFYEIPETRIPNNETFTIWECFYFRVVILAIFKSSTRTGKRSSLRNIRGAGSTISSRSRINRICRSRWKTTPWRSNWTSDSTRFGGIGIAKTSAARREAFLSAPRSAAFHVPICLRRFSLPFSLRSSACLIGR